MKGMPVGDCMPFFSTCRIVRQVILLVVFLFRFSTFACGSRGLVTVIFPRIHKAAKPPLDAFIPPIFHSSISGIQIHSPATLPEHLDYYKHQGMKKFLHAPAAGQSIPFHKHYSSMRSSSLASASHRLFPPFSQQQGVVMPPPLPLTDLHKRSRHKSHGAADIVHGPSLFPVESPHPTKNGWGNIPPLSSAKAPSPTREGSIHSPMTSPSLPFRGKQWKPSPKLLSPPPNYDCSAFPCTEPLTNTPPGSPCGCVLPMQVGLHLSVNLYTFFPLVLELAQEIASGLLLNQSQVRIMGANSVNQDLDKTLVIINLVPMDDKFDNSTAFLAFEKFWQKKITIKASIFGDYEVVYVQYPGLPPSPPVSPTNVAINGQLSSNKKPNTMKPLGVYIRRQNKRLHGSVIAIMALSSSVLLILCAGCTVFLLIRSRKCNHQLTASLQPSLPLGKQSGGGTGSMLFGGGPSSASLSISSSIAAYALSAKTFSIFEIEKATDNFNLTRMLGEGGFGRVYRGNLEDGTEVAVKVLKRDDHQGSREFLAEIEMLSRLHHRNLVKLLGICTEENNRCLIYELIPNGSVESHLHGSDQKVSPLDWHSRMKIALGSARGLAYLHEDSNPCVIHRDFKSSNILLENDFTPKVSDFGLARTALDGGMERTSTHVMGTFGYLAPEYAMTGHLLAKSDVYSYGVVLLELLTGRKPVDMSQNPGQENLVTWARPFLTSRKGLEMMMDPSLGPDYPFHSAARVAAIASMCVQPEVSQRPSMSEVVQALQLIFNECDDELGTGCSGNCNQDDLLAQGTETVTLNGSGQLPESLSFASNHGSGLEAEWSLSTSDTFYRSARFSRQESISFRRHSASGPPSMSKNSLHWSRSWFSGSLREHGVALKSLAEEDWRRGGCDSD